MSNNKVKISHNMTGTYYIQKGDKEIEINLNELSLEEQRELINGIGNLLMGLACSMRERKK